MTTIKAVVRNGRIETEEPLSLADGTELLIPLPNGTSHAIGSTPGDAPMARSSFGDIDFMTEDEQSDDLLAIQEWLNDLQSLPPVPVNAEKEAEWAAWEEKMRAFNIEAVRKQFETATP